MKITGEQLISACVNRLRVEYGYSDEGTLQLFKIICQTFLKEKFEKVARRVDMLIQNPEIIPNDVREELDSDYDTLESGVINETVKVIFSDEEMGIRQLVSWFLAPAD